MTKLVPPGELEHQLKTRLVTLESERATKRAARKGTRGHARVRLAGLTGVIGLLLLSVGGVFAVHDEGFQLDGNATAADLTHGTVCIDLDGSNQTPCTNVPAGTLTGAFAGPYDWDSLFNIEAGAAPGNALGTVSGPKAVLPGDFVAADFQKDFGNTGTTFVTSDNTTFATGSKDELDIPDWQCNTDNNVNSKTDIINGFAAISDDGDDQIVYFGLEKDVDNGNNNVGVWLLQDQNVGCTSAGGNTDFTGEHQVGDILIVSAFTNGGGVSNIDVYQWDPATTDATNPLDLLASGVDCLLTTAGDSVCATVFQPDTEGGDDTLSMPWLSADNSVVNAPHPSPNFYEGGINLSAFPQFADRCFTGYLLDTRSSQSTDATLFDYVFGNFGTCEPEIEVTKSPSVDDVCAGSDTSVTYSYTVTNTGNVDLTNVDVSDDTIPGAQAAFEAANGGSDDIAEGAPPVQFQLVATINATTTNIVTVDADSQVGADSASDTATATVTAHDCTITVTKSDPDDVCDGGQVTYDYSITNNSDFYTWEGTLIDDQLGDVGGGTITLAPGETQNFSANANITGSVTNIVTGDGTFDDSDSTTASDTATATVESHDCTITVTKSDPADVCDGGEVTYDYSITNNSDEFTWEGTLIDDQLGDVGGGTITLAPGETQNFSANANITGSVTNIVTGDGTFDDPNSTSASDTATATVASFDCTISITKVPDVEDVCNGSTVGYTIEVTNNSPSFTWTGDVTDDVLGTLETGLVLAPGASKTYTPSHAITGTVTNIVTADGNFDDASSSSASDTATATVTGHVCTITVTKSDPDDVCDGGEVTYDYSITNNSDEFTWTGTLIDDQLGDVGGGPITLLPGETQNFSANANITGSVTNIVTGDGTFDDQDSTSASDTATATVESHLCEISITKVPSDTEVCDGDTVSYTITVTNNSDTFTWTGDVVDDILGTLETGLVLAPGASKVYTPDHVINGTVTNTVTATGSFDDPASTSANASDDATVVGTPCGGGCTPGFWQGGFGKDLWDEVDDQDWVDAGGVGTNPFVTTDLFSTGPWGPSGVTGIDSKTMLEIVGSGGGGSWAKKAARDLIAAYLNSSFGIYPFTTTEILDDWADAVAAGTSGFREFHAKYGAANELGCTIGDPIIT
jgi:uncharacterized repeat protein (TIGR01451 family)